MINETWRVFEHLLLDGLLRGDVPAQVKTKNAERRERADDNDPEQPFSGPDFRLNLLFVYGQKPVAGRGHYSSWITRTEKSVNFALLQVYMTFLTIE